MAKRRKRAKKRSSSRAVCPKRYKGAKVRSKKMRGGTRCYIVRKSGQWRFVPKKGGKSKKRAKSRRRSKR